MRNLLHKVFGRLKVIAVASPDEKTRNRRWFCVCECGTVRTVWESALLREHTKSCGCLHKFEKSVAARNQVRDSYRRGATKRDVSWDLSDAEFDTLVSQVCWYCGDPPSNVAKSKTGDFRYSGIDRLKNSAGYISINCVACCKTCNFMKRTLGTEEFLQHIRKITTWRLASL